MVFHFYSIFSSLGDNAVPSVSLCPASFPRWEPLKRAGRGTSRRLPVTTRRRTSRDVLSSAPSWVRTSSVHTATDVPFPGIEAPLILALGSESPATREGKPCESCGPSGGERHVQTGRPSSRRRFIGRLHHWGGWRLSATVTRPRSQSTWPPPVLRWTFPLAEKARQPIM